MDLLRSYGRVTSAHMWLTQQKTGLAPNPAKFCCFVVKRSWFLSALLREGVAAERNPKESTLLLAGPPPRHQQTTAIAVYSDIALSLFNCAVPQCRNVRSGSIPAHTAGIGN
jgi:hypothetical protein